MSRLPRKSPWGDVKRCGVLYKGIFTVSADMAEERGGIMVRLSSAKVLSEAALKCGVRNKGYYIFDRKTSEPVIIRELLDKNLWEIPHYIGDKAKYEEKINTSLQQNQPEYWSARQKRPPLSERLKEGAKKAADHNAKSIDKDDTRSNKTEVR